MKHNLSPCEKRLADLGIDVWSNRDDDECDWRGTLIDRLETKIINLTVDIKGLVADNLELKKELETMKDERDHQA